MPSQSCLTHLSPPVLDPGSLSGNFGEDTRTEWPPGGLFPPSGRVPVKVSSHPSSLPSQRPGLDSVDSEAWRSVADRGFSISGPNGVSAGASSLKMPRTSLCVLVVNNPQIVFDFCSVFLYFYSKLSASDFMGIHQQFKRHRGPPAVKIAPS